MFVNSNGDPPPFSSQPFDIIPTNNFSGIGSWGEGVKQVLTMPDESTMQWGDFLTIISAVNGDGCKPTMATCPNDSIVRTLSAAKQPFDKSSWKDISPTAQFGPGQVAGIFPSGGHTNLTLYVLTSNDSSIPYSSPRARGQLWKGQSSQQEAISSWTSAMGTSPNQLIRAGYVFVNPYEPNELYAVDLGDSTQDPAIKISRDGGQSWTTVPELKAIATNNGEYSFGCGNGSSIFGGINHKDKDILGNECSLAFMAFSRDAPDIRVATLYPGGVAFSSDDGLSWTPLDVTNAGSSEPIELPISAFYDPRPNPDGTSALYVALQGKGVKRVDLATFACVRAGGQCNAASPCCSPNVCSSTHTCAPAPPPLVCDHQPRPDPGTCAGNVRYHCCEAQWHCGCEEGVDCEGCALQ
jgi:hypothetical protein